MRGRLLQDGYNPLAVDTTLPYTPDQQRRHNITHTIPLTAAIADTTEYDSPAEPMTRGEYTPEQVLAALQNWGDLEEMRARGRMPTLLQCVYLDIQQAAEPLDPYSPVCLMLNAAQQGAVNGDPRWWYSAHTLCRLMNGGANGSR